MLGIVVPGMEFGVSSTALGDPGVDSVGEYHTSDLCHQKSPSSMLKMDGKVHRNRDI